VKREAEGEAREELEEQHRRAVAERADREAAHKVR
jgi:hypothetical protein